MISREEPQRSVALGSLSMAAQLSTHKAMGLMSIDTIYCQTEPGDIYQEETLFIHRVYFHLYHQLNKILCVTPMCLKKEWRGGGTFSVCKLIFFFFFFLHSDI